ALSCIMVTPPDYVVVLNTPEHAGDQWYASSDSDSSSSPASPGCGSWQSPLLIRASAVRPWEPWSRYARPLLIMDWNISNISGSSSSPASKAQISSLMSAM